MATSEDIKAAAIRLLVRGIITKSEAARLAGVSRQMVNKWAKGIPWERNRAAYLAGVWKKVTRQKR